MRSWLSALVLGSALAACPDSDGSSDAGADGSPTDGSTAGLFEVAPPEPPTAPAPPATPTAPALPGLLPCPTGWAETDLGDGRPPVCSPWPASTDPGACAADEAVFPGQATCTRVGMACPAGEFAAGLPPNAVYVDVDAAPGGDGSLAAPFDDLSTAVASASSGDVLALGKGRLGGATIARSLTLRGACVRGTTTGNLVIRAEGVAVRDLTVRGRVEADGAGWSTPARLSGVVVDRGGDTNIVVHRGARAEAMDVATRGPGAGVLVDGASLLVVRGAFDDGRAYGAFAQNGATMRLEDVAVRNARLDASGNRGYGIGAIQSAVNVLRTAVDGARSVGVVLVGPGTTGLLEDVVVHDVEADGAGNFGLGLTLQEADVVVSRLWSDGCRGIGLQAQRGATVQLTDAVLQNVAGLASDGNGGRGLSIETSSSVEADRVWIEATHELGVETTGRATVLANDLAVRDVRPRTSDGVLGVGIGVDFSEITASRVRVERVHSTGVNVQAGSTGTLEDITVTDVQPRASTMSDGQGIEIFDSTIELRRVLVERAREAGVRLEASPLVAEDLTIRETLPDGITDEGWGLILLDGPAEVERVSVSESVSAAAWAGGAATDVTLRDVSIRDTASRPGDGRFGRGLQFHAGSTALVERAIIERNREVGIGVSLPGTRLTLRDAAIRDTLPTVAGEHGRGINVQEGGTVMLQRVLAEDSGQAGVVVFGNADVDDLVAEISDLEISGTATEGGGIALSAEMGAMVSGMRIHVAGSRGFGVVSSSGAVSTYTELAVRGLQPTACTSDDCPVADGSAVLAAGGAITVSRFLSADSALCGVHVANDGSMDLSMGDVTRAAIGACVGVAGYDLGRLTDEVRYVDNALNLDSISLPVPEPLGAVEAGMPTD